ncbi:hypothetical protein CKAH01_15670 [Colletotrichum kahawae]|uniref:Uncharacterized protein n=1 Tax=Colletotrichum kahawae TaxID=34407 RepID=A0AAD9YIL7_COLKA|nr:hypothetical protein CKAH01_15670 [Colletotrichum kahawae]
MKPTGKEKKKEAHSHTQHTHTGRLCLPKCRSLHRGLCPCLTPTAQLAQDSVGPLSAVRIKLSILHSRHGVSPFRKVTHIQAALLHAERTETGAAADETRTAARAPVRMSGRLSLSVHHVCVCVYVSPHLLTHSLGCHAVWSPLACQAQCLRPHHHHHHHHCHCSCLVCPATRLFYRDLSSTS